MTSAISTLCLVLLCLCVARASSLCRKMVDLVEANGTISYSKSVIHWSNVDDFLVTKRIASGSFGEAYLGHNTSSRDMFLFKMYKLGKLSVKRMKREIAITQHVCGHPSIIQLHYVVKQSFTGYPVLLFEYINNTNYHTFYPTLSPQDIRYYAHELLKGIAFAHKRGVVHKDIKPANVMIDHSRQKLKIIDWGLSEFYIPGKEQGASGTTPFMAPELLLNYPYSSYSVDMWAYGCILGGWIFRVNALFPGRGAINQLHTIAKSLGTDDLVDYVLKYDLYFNTSSIARPIAKAPWEKRVNVTDPSSVEYAPHDAVDLLGRLLVYDHNQRFTAEEALRHPYFTDGLENNRSAIHKIYYQDRD